MCHEIQKSDSVGIIIIIIIIMLRNALNKYIFLASRRNYFLWIDIGHETLIVEVHNTVGSKSCFVCEKHWRTQNKAETQGRIKLFGAPRQ